jgi:hypothetical protein
MKKRVALVIAALLAAVVPVGGSARAQTDDRSAIQALLDVRADAFLQRDKDAFLATLDPKAGVPLKREQARMFANAAAIPFASYELVADWSAFGDLARPRDVARYPGAGTVVIPMTHERYRIRGFDEVDAVEDVFFTFVERDGSWYIAGDTDLDDIGLFSVRHAWDFGRLETTRSEHFLALGPACVVGGALCAGDELLGIAEEALVRTDQTWTVPWRDKVVMIVPPSDAALKRMLQASFDVGDFVAFAYATVDPETLDYTGDRVLVNPSVIAGRAREQVLRILAHEFLHVATRDSSGPFVPLFVDEGLAEVAGYGGVRGLAYFDAIVAAGSFDDLLPEDFQFSTGSANDIYLSYQEAQSAVRYFIERWGKDRFLKFYRKLGSARVTPGLATWHVERALRRTIHLGLGAFEEAWASSIGA